MTRGRVFKRGRLWWIAYSYKGEEKRETSHSEDKTEAEALLGRRLAEIGADRTGSKPFRGPEMGRVLVTELVENLLHHYEITRKPSLVTAQVHLKPVIEAFRKERVRDVDPARLRRYVEQRTLKGIAPATIQVELAFLKRAYNLALEDETIAFVPKFPSIHVDNARQGFFEAGDFEAVCRELPDYARDVAQFAYLTSWRKNEVLSLKWEDVDLRENTVHLPSKAAKTNRGRVIALEGDLLDLIRARKQVQVTLAQQTGKITEWVFHREGEQIKSIRTAWEAACRRAGVKGMLFHDLRRTAIRNMIRAGVSQNVAMKISGHRTDSIFRRYDIVDDRDLRDAALKIQAHREQTPRGRTIAQLQGH